LLRFWLEARTSFFIDQFAGFSFVNIIAEALYRSGSARHPVSFANQKPRAPKSLSFEQAVKHKKTKYKPVKVPEVGLYKPEEV